MNRILLINKPMGLTSFEVVSKCRKKLGEKKAGHSGTLDPNAEGLMIVAFGKYTKLLPYVVSNHKHYIATFSLGKKYDTQDVWGNIVAEKKFMEHSNEELTKVAESFIGNITQIPPMYSALKKDGKKLYEYARKGIEVERSAREVVVNDLIVEQIGENQYRMDATVSSGTYIRTLIEDYCTRLGEFGYMTSLKRIAIEHLTIEQAIKIDALDDNDFVDPLLFIDPSWKIMEVKNRADAINGKMISINTNENRVILVHGNEILASYQRREDGLFHCVRGLY